MSDQSPDLSTLLAECEEAHQKMTCPLALSVTVQLDGNVRIDDAIEDAPFARMCQGQVEQKANAHGIVTLVKAYPYLRDEIRRLRALIARTVVVMDGSWDMLPAHEQDRLAEELRRAALTDAPAPQEKAGTPRSADAL